MNWVIRLKWLTLELDYPSGVVDNELGYKTEVVNNELGYQT